MKNPISMQARGQLYVTAIVVGASSLVATAVLQVLGFDQWLSVVTALTAATSMVAGSLGRDNLTEIPAEREDRLHD